MPQIIANQTALNFSAKINSQRIWRTNNMPFWAEAFIIGSFVFVLLAIPTVIVTYLNQAVCKNSNNEFKVSRTKNQSSFDRIITASARIGLRLIGLLILLWVAYNVFI